MKASLELEVFGLRDRQAIQDFDRFCWRNGILSYEGGPPMSPWVAEIVEAESGPGVMFLPGKRDYSKENSRGSRGVTEHFILSEDRLYRVSERVSWRNSDEYWVAVTPNGEIYRLSDDEAQEWLNNMM